MTLPPGSDAGGTTDCCSVPTPTVIPSNRSKCHFVAPNRRRSVTTLPLPASGSLPSTLAVVTTGDIPCNGNGSAAEDRP